MKILRSMAVWLAAGGLAIGAGSVAWAQGNGQRNGSQGAQSQAGASGQTTQPPSLSTGADDMVHDRTAHMEEEQEKSRNSDRQKKLVSDTERLLALANELKAEVDKTNKDTLSLDVIRKADEIEKLAHSVKEKMKGT